MSANWHVIGTTQEGKSKLLELIADFFLRIGQGFIFFDPTPNASTAYKILSRCERRGKKKVLLIDPSHRYKFNAIPTLNLFEEYRDTSVTKIMNTLRVLFAQKEAAETPRINRFFPALLRTLWANKLTLHEAENFLFLDKEPYKSKRAKILEGLLDKQLWNDPVHQRDYHTLKEVFTPKEWPHFESTINRLQPFLDSTLDLIFGVRERIDFADLIGDNWVVLVNLDDEDGLEELHIRLLATALINEIESSIKRLIQKNWKRKYYLFLDEAGEYATSKVSRILDLKQKTGLNIIVSHQRYGQLPPDLVNAVNGNTKIKVAYYLADHKDRREIVHQMYGGELTDREVEYALSNQRRRRAVFKIYKKAPVVATTVAFPDLPKVSKGYIQKIYQQSKYVTPNEILHDQQQRFYENPKEETLNVQTKQARTDPPTSDQGAVVDGSASYHTNLGEENGTLSVFDYFDRTYGVRRNLPSFGEDG